jgi:hypothetical protein
MQNLFASKKNIQKNWRKLVNIYLILKSSEFGNASAVAVDDNGCFICEVEHSDERALCNLLEREVIDKIGVGVEFVNHIGKPVPQWLRSKIEASKIS